MVHLLDIGTQNVTLCMGGRGYAQSSKKKEFNRNLYLEYLKQMNRPLACGCRTPPPDCSQPLYTLDTPPASLRTPRTPQPNTKGS